MLDSAHAAPRFAAGDSHGFAWVYRFGADGRATLAQPDDDFRLDAPGEGFVWVHLNLADKRAQEWLSAQETIPEAARRMLTSSGEHQHLDQADRYIFGVTVDLVRELDKTSETIGHLRFMLGERFLLSARRHPLQGPEAARAEIESGRLLVAPAALFEAIVDRVIDALALAIQAHVDELNEIEDRVLDFELHDERKRLGPIRRASARLHRQLTGMRSIFHRFEIQAQAAYSGDVRAAATRLVQRIDSLHEELHSTQERARLLQEETSAKLTNETNRNLALLTAVTTLLLPPTFITGMFGMNVKGLLFADNDYGFLYAMLICALSSLLVYLLMRRMGILR
jgi:zinc transporter